MKFRKIIGILIICLSLLTLTLTIMLAQVSMHVDKLVGSFWNEVSRYLPLSAYLFIGIAFVLGFYLILSKDK
ncbi:hypothetical protein [Caloranaerobacter sp. DY30410]|uniref:hypothetical protein n=1 Tax=Caloranaerobacter sp. DY30410 TaxID=3238305 RepID=UPI003CFF8C06